MMNIVSILAKMGAKYSRHAYGCDVFVTCEIIGKGGEPYRCYRHEKVLSAINDGKEIEIITLDELFEILETDNEALKELKRSSLSPVKIRKFANF